MHVYVWISYVCISLYAFVIRQEQLLNQVGYPSQQCVVGCNVCQMCVSSCNNF